MNVTPAYRGYIGRMDVDTEAGLIHGEVLGLRDVITFQGTTPAEAIRAFRESVDDYLAYCAELGRAPEKSYSGKLLVRTRPQTHRALADLAAAYQISVNALVDRLLSRFARRKLGSRSPAAGQAHEEPAAGAARKKRSKVPTRRR